MNEPTLARLEWVAQLLVVVGRIQLDLNRLIYYAGRVGGVYESDGLAATVAAMTIKRDLADARKTFETLAERVAELVGEVGR